MTKGIKYVGLDVRAESISAAVSEGRGEVRSLGKIFSTPEAVRRLLCKLGKLSELRVCYEAGPTGYALYWQLTKMGVQCEVIAPSLIPKKAGDRVKTDRRDAELLARSYRAGDLTPVWVPDLIERTKGRAITSPATQRPASVRSGSAGVRVMG